MPYDAVNMADWQISEEAEKNMPTPEEWREKLGLEKDEMLPMGRLAKLDFLKIIDRLKNKSDGKYIEVFAHAEVEGNGLYPRYNALRRAYLGRRRIVGPSSRGYLPRRHNGVSCLQQYALFGRHCRACGGGCR